MSISVPTLPTPYIQQFGICSGMWDMRYYIFIIPPFALFGKSMDYVNTRFLDDFSTKSDNFSHNITNDSKFKSQIRKLKIKNHFCKQTCVVHLIQKFTSFEFQTYFVIVFKKVFLLDGVNIWNYLTSSNHPISI